MASFVELFEANANLGNQLLENPDKTLEEFDRSVQTAQQHVLIDLSKDMEVEDFSLKMNVHCRVHALPVCTELHRNLLPANQDLGMFLQITGTANI